VEENQFGGGLTVVEVEVSIPARVRERQQRSRQRPRQLHWFVPWVRTYVGAQVFVRAICRSKSMALWMAVRFWRVIHGVEGLPWIAGRIVPL